jgi:hypothetical protein
VLLLGGGMWESLSRELLLQVPWTQRPTMDEDGR